MPSACVSFSYIIIQEPTYWSKEFGNLGSSEPYRVLLFSIQKSAVAYNGMCWSYVPWTIVLKSAGSRFWSPWKVSYFSIESDDWFFWRYKNTASGPYLQFFSGPAARASEAQQCAYPLPTPSVVHRHSFPKESPSVWRGKREKQTTRGNLRGKVGSQPQKELIKSRQRECYVVWKSVRLFTAGVHCFVCVCVLLLLRCFWNFSYGLAFQGFLNLWRNLV